MSLWIAFRAFFKALKSQKEALKFLQEEPLQTALASDEGHLKLAALLQQQGRLIDFLQEEIEGYSDAQVGAAVRPIHQQCRRVIEETMNVQPLLLEQEGANIVIADNYDTQSIKVIGRVKGSAPYQGIVRHRGWKAQKQRLASALPNKGVLAPAEVEIL